MLNIYIGKDSLPTNMFLINDPDSAIGVVDVSGTEFQRMVIEQIEKGSYHSKDMFKDRFGGLLYYSSMSTGSKSLIVADYLKDRITCMDECGENALVMLSYLKDGNIYFSNRRSPIPCIASNNEVYCFGKVWRNLSHLNSMLG